ncbi:hypothetical protein PVAP13_3NG248400 [Panicum virgatum]|uniref:Uncharacterized protein n=1 Tax=Panicum virgatum TaxID=38727 RepID=A0A8T0UKF4_PANVG|nr:hypothetical protein PVAP13_3NG248400 [Panicum virgatum]
MRRRCRRVPCARWAAPHSLADNPRPRRGRGHVWVRGRRLLPPVVPCVLVDGEGSDGEPSSDPVHRRSVRRDHRGNGGHGNEVQCRRREEGRRIHPQVQRNEGAASPFLLDEVLDQFLLVLPWWWRLERPSCLCVRLLFSIQELDEFSFQRASSRLRPCFCVAQY